MMVKAYGMFSYVKPDMAVAFTLHAEGWVFESSRGRPH